jgi:hypothetical protein
MLDLVIAFGGGWFVGVCSALAIIGAFGWLVDRRPF